MIAETITLTPPFNKAVCRLAGDAKMLVVRVPAVDDAAEAATVMVAVMDTEAEEMARATSPKLTLAAWARTALMLACLASSKSLTSPEQVKDVMTVAVGVPGGMLLVSPDGLAAAVSAAAVSVSMGEISGVVRHWGGALDAGGLAALG